LSKKAEKNITTIINKNITIQNLALLILITFIAIKVKKPVSFIISTIIIIPNKIPKVSKLTIFPTFSKSNPETGFKMKSIVARKKVIMALFIFFEKIIK
jgi:hypothetical protein